MEVPVKHHLPLRNVPGQIRNRMGNIIIGHGQNRKLCHRAAGPLHNPRPLIKRGQLTVQIPRIPLSGGNLSPGRRHLTHRFRKRRHIRQNHQNMHITLKRQILRHRKRHLRRNQTLYHRVIGQIQEHTHMVRHAALLKSLAEKLRNIMLDAHRPKHHGKILIRPVPKGRLFHNLRRQLVMGKPVPRKNRKLLPPNQRGQPVNGRDSRPDIIPWILPADRIQRQAVHVSLLGRPNRPKPVNRHPDAVKRTPQHFRGNRHLHGMSGQPRMGIPKRHILRSLEDLNHRLILIQLHNTAHLLRIAVHHKLHNLIKKRTLQPFQHNKRAVYTAKTQIFNRHIQLPPYAFFAITRL